MKKEIHEQERISPEALNEIYEFLDGYRPKVGIAFVYGREDSVEVKNLNWRIVRKGRNPIFGKLDDQEVEKYKDFDVVVRLDEIIYLNKRTPFITPNGEVCQELPKLHEPHEKYQPTHFVKPDGSLWAEREWSEDPNLYPENMWPPTYSEFVRVSRENFLAFLNAKAQPNSLSNVKRVLKELKD